MFSVNEMRIVSALVLCGLSAAAGAQEQRPPLVLEDEGSFFVGGRELQGNFNGTSISGPASPGMIALGQMYVQYRIPVAAGTKPVPVIMIHGSRHTGKTYETTPDGREGWATYFVRKGFSTYVADGPGLGRSGFNAQEVNRVKANNGPIEALPGFGVTTRDFLWTGARIGPSPGVPFSDSQFPAEAMGQYFQSSVPNTVGTLPPTAWADALTALLDKTGPAILMAHSLSGPSSWKAAAARTANARAVIAIEPGQCPAEGDAASLTAMPHLILYGDHLNKPALDNLAACRAFAARVQAAGGRAEVVELPSIGQRGNSHVLMMEKNNREIADFVIGWIAKNVTVR